MMMTLQAKASIEVIYTFITMILIDYFQASSTDKQIETKPIEYHPVAKEIKTTYKEDDYVYNDDKELKIDADLDWGDDKGDEDFEVDTNQYQNNANKTYNTTPVDIHKIASISKSTKKTKCEIALLGNFTSNSNKLCTSLLCTKCDVKVSFFKNKKWDSSVTYLFFRNNYSRPNKLEEKLLDAYGTCAYSCQCNWKNITDDCIVASKVSNWTCLGH